MIDRCGNDYQIISLRRSPSQKIVWRFLYDFFLSSAWIGIKFKIIFVHVLIQLKEGCLIVAAVAVVRGAKYSANHVAMLQLVSLVHQLMGSSHHLKIVCVVKFLSHVLL